MRDTEPSGYKSCTLKAVLHVSFSQTKFHIDINFIFNTNIDVCACVQMNIYIRVYMCTCI